MEVLPARCAPTGAPRRRRGARGEAHRPAAGVRALRRRRRAAGSASSGAPAEHLLVTPCGPKTADEAPLTRYLFIADRLRAVVQDVTVQRLHCDAIFGRIARFHAWAATRRTSRRVPPSAGLRRRRKTARLQRADLAAAHAPPTPPPGREAAPRRPAPPRAASAGATAAAPRRPAARVPGGAGARRPNCAATPPSTALSASPRRRADGAALARAPRAAPPLGVGARCGARRARAAAALEQHNAAYNNRRGVPARRPRAPPPPTRRTPPRASAATSFVALEPAGATARRRALRAAPFRAPRTATGRTRADGGARPARPPPVDLAEMNAEATDALMRLAPASGAEGADVVVNLQACQRGKARCESSSRSARPW